MWERLGAVAPALLAAARQELHWGARLVASAGATLLAPRADDSHTSMTWLPGERALAGEPLGGGRRAALRLADQTLRAGGQEAALAGRTFDEALAWLAGALGVAALAPPTSHRLPDHPLAHGARFGAADGAALAELARWVGNAAVLVEEARAAEGGSPVRCWPHHFDLATLLPAGAGRTIGVGLSPGDDGIAEPYLYVSPWPPPPPGVAPDLDGGGVWHTAGWTGAVLRGGVLVGRAEPEASARAFVRSAIAACRALAPS